MKFSSDYQYNHHFVWLGANQRTNKWSAFGKAGLKPDGTYYSTRQPVAASYYRLEQRPHRASTHDVASSTVVGDA